jgi:hypothetical protein
MDVISETGEVIRSFSTTTETGEVVSMEIRPSTEGDVGIRLRGVLADLEARIDKTQIKPITIRTEQELQEVTDALIEDKRETADVEQTLKPFADLAFNIHRTITGERNRLAWYSKERASIRDAAIAEHAAEQKRIVEAENNRIREVARKEEEARRAAEAAELTKRARMEKRPDLKLRAEELKKEPIREVAITSQSNPIGRKIRGSSGGSVGLRSTYTIEVTDSDAFILAAARPHIYREVLDLLAKAYGKKKAPALLEPLRARLGELPQIPLTMLEPVESRIKSAAADTNGKINWPGVAVSEDLKTTARR